MKKMMIFEPPMCCSTGLCGPSVNSELLRVAAAINKLTDKGMLIERYNLNSNPQKFVENIEINKMLNENGAKILPITMVDGVIVKTKTYPTNKEFCKLLGISEKYLEVTIKKPSKGCGCKGGCC